MTRQRPVDGICRIDRLSQPLAERSQVTDMVQMVMSHKNSGKGIQSKSVLHKSLLKASEANSSIDQ